jgi:hypothetical protein
MTVGAEGGCERLRLIENVSAGGVGTVDLERRHDRAVEADWIVLEDAPDDPTRERGGRELKLDAAARDRHVPRDRRFRGGMDPTDGGVGSPD